MKRLGVLVVVCIVVNAGSARAQSKLSGKCSYPKPAQADAHVVPVGDKPNHALVLIKETCTWAPGAEMAGVTLKDEVDVMTSDMSGATSRDRGYGVGTLANGDKYYVRFDGTTKYRGQDPVSGTCTWSLTGGTGKLRGITGKGTCNGTFDATGASVFDIEGEYQIPPAKTSK